MVGMAKGRRTQLLKGLPTISTVEENAAAGVSLCTFNVTLSPLPPEGVAILPTIVNSNPLTTAFDIVPKGDLEYMVVTTGDPVLDYETMPKSFDLQIFVEDITGRTDLKTLTVRIIDKNEHPVFRGNMAIQTVTLYVLEGAPQGRIYQVYATDPENAELKYSLLPAPVPFLVLENGDIFSTKVFDYERDQHCYFLNITVTDPGGLNLTKTVNINIININDERPYFTTKQRIYRIKEEQSPGTPVANITAKDPDDEDSPSRLFYSIQSSDRYFSINPSTGVLQVTRRIDRDAFPLRLHPNVSVIVRVEDSPSGGHASEMEITVIIDDINDNSPECNPSTFRKEANENMTAGTFLLELRNYCADTDIDPLNNRFNFTGLSGFGSNNFALESAVSGRLVMTGSIDLENPANLGVAVYSLTVRVQDIAYPDYSNIIYIYIRIKPVNDYFPVFNDLSYEFNVPEITKVGSSIGRVSARDKDWPPSVITYSIVAGGSIKDYTNLFWISPSKGVVKILARLDYETTQKHILVVQASDQEKSATASVTVNVLEVNDEEPFCSPNFYSFQIPVSLAVGTNINGFKIECKDRDSDPRSFRYFINEGNVNNHFTFSPSAGSNTSRLILASRFDYENGLDTNWIYRLRVYITDDNLLSARNKATHLIKTGTVTLNIRVIPNPTTVVATTPSFTVVMKKENLFSESAWYVPFIITLSSLLLLGLLGYLGFLLVKWLRTHCPPSGKADGTPLMNAPEKKKPKKEVIMTMTKLNTVFDGEARDPVTGKIYEFNTQSGARRWKKSSESLQLAPGMQVISSATDDDGQGTDRVQVLSKKEPSEKRKEPTGETKPAAPTSAGQLERTDGDEHRLQKQK
ncbi:cadherin-related family member 3 isoform X3 [Cuculus canorus]|uniref:cadherin-related family member 3 isoform X3 n=1 Tax=Cuculus canorus TaxID=55661 RepID=UPI0023AA6F76|nr:cadherin-related family member 3 isoform X3 [Cuculus canorus]XP_053905686.1 cadherin-related family member 3 isoform X3 [Cuculus canorus]XP_053905692.1 cadherin-related family member 3 isoform X3 [Cuculus canorus]XP_053905699.1 cadherin-related family member 3 isoform X3 [Cuculus canorus]